MNDEDEKGRAPVPTPGGDQDVRTRPANGGDLGGAEGHAGPASRRDIPTTGAEDSGPSGTSVVTETVTTHSGRETTYQLGVRQRPTTAEGEAEQLRSVVARCQALADWLSRHSSLGVDVEADSIRRAIAARLHTALGAPPKPAEWERHGCPSVQGRCPACGNTRLFLGSGGYVTCPRIGCPEPDAASTLLAHAVGIGQLAPDRDQAAAAVERVRAECAAIGTPHICNAVDRILAVLDQPKEQP